MIKKANIVIIYPFIFLLLQQAILNYTGGIITYILSGFDEAYIIFLWLVGLKKNGLVLYLQREDIKILALSGLFLILGIISNIGNEFQTIGYALSDAYICIKFLLIYLGIKQYVRTKQDNERIVLHIYQFCKAFISICFILGIINCFFPIFPTVQSQYFINTISLFFPQPTYLAIASITAVCVIITKQAVLKENKDMVFIIQGLLLTCLTFRSKAIAGALCILLIYLYFVKFRMKNKLIAGAGVLILSFMIGFDKLVFYFGGNSRFDSNFVRERLLIDSVNIANRFFPLGSGFGTFASNIAATHWSTLYNEYNYVYGPFLSDSFWPIVIAQTGWIGLGIFVLIIGKLILRIVNLQKVNIYLFWAGLSIMCYELICSVAESAFFNPAVCPLFIVFGLIIKQGEYIKNDYDS